MVKYQISCQVFQYQPEKSLKEHRSPTINTLSPTSNGMIYQTSKDILIHSHRTTYLYALFSDRIIIRLTQITKCSSISPVSAADHNNNNNSNNNNNNDNKNNNNNLPGVTTASHGPAPPTGSDSYFLLVLSKLAYCTVNRLCQSWSNSWWIFHRKLEAIYF